MAGVIADHGYDGLMLATFMSGIILLVAGHFRAGRLIAYVPEAGSSRCCRPWWPKMIEGSHRPNAELLTQGAANIGSALSTGLPATGAIARTATNVRAGGKTPVAGIVHALVVLIFMMVAAPFAGPLAMPALAALLIVTAWNMSEPHKWRGYVQGRTSDTVLLLLTLFLTVVIDLTVAISVGVGVGLALRFGRRSVDSDWTPPER